MPVFEVNGETRELADARSIIDLLDILKLENRRVAVMVNDVIVRREHHAQTVLNPGDRIEIIQMVGGG